ncbi:MAG TPA: cytochrome c biogenesis protein CcsA, partial [Candidatus Limnocylindrales bacterium]
MERLSGLLFSIGVIAMALAFAAHVANTVLLANGRRVLAAIAPRQPQPAFAGAVTGSFVERIEERSSMGSGGLAGDQTSRIAPAALALTLIALALIGSSMALRAYLVGRGPWGNMFEFTVAFSFTIVAGYTLLQRRYPIQAIGFLPVGVALGLLLYAASLPSDIKPLVPALENRPLLTIHVGMATIAYGIFATSFAAGVAYLVQGRNDRFAWLPSHKVLDEVAYRAVVIGFPIFATMIILGSWWASIAWSRYWGWDPKETAALVTWLTYAV